MNKWTIAILAMLACGLSASAFDVPVRYPDGRIREGWPTRIGAVQNPTPETCEAAGYALATAQQVEAQAQADAAAQAQADAEAAAQATLPQVFETGIAVVDESGHHVELLPTGDGLPVIGAQVSNSPLTKEQRDELKAAMKDAVAARKAEAKAAKTYKDKIDILMEAVFGITE